MTEFLNKNRVSLYLFVALLCMFPFMSPALALCAGIILSLAGVKDQRLSGFTSAALQASIVLMGFSMNLKNVAETSSNGFILTACSVTFTLIVGMAIAKMLGVDKKTAMLISSGTAICGGSAIAAVAPVIKAKANQISFALVVVFILNAVALFIFPTIGHYFGMSEHSFGYWAAIAIHDTSSVVGAGATYGPKALEIATTVKLSRALWIIPLTLTVAFANGKDQNAKRSKVKIPWFIFLYVAAIIFASIMPQWQESYVHIGWLGRRGLVLALFFIGLNITVKDAKDAGIKSFVLGVVLWIIVSVASYAAISLSGL